MRKLLAVVAVSGFTAFLASPAFAQQETTVTGKLIDNVCLQKFGKDKAASDGHAACNMKCAKNGNALAIVTEKDVYVVTGDFTNEKNAKLVDLVNKQVTATGHSSEKEGKKELHVMSIKEAAK